MPSCQKVLLFATIGNMPTTSKKKVTRRKSAVSEMIDADSYSVSTNSPSSSKIEKFKKNKFVLIGIAVIIIALILAYKKGLLVAATVNGSPITTLEVLQREDAQLHKQMVDQIITERLILGEATKKNIKISSQEIDTEIVGIEKQVGGADALNSLLTQQGQTRADLIKNVTIKLSLEKLYSNEASVSAEDIAKFIEQNKEQMQSSDEAGLAKEATDYLKSQKLNQVFTQKLQELKTAANIKIF